MTLVVTLNAHIDCTGDYSWWELTSQCRVHRQDNRGIPLAVDATQALQHDCRTWPGQWIGSVIPFILSHKLDDRLPRRAPRHGLPSLSALENRLVDLQQDRRRTLQ